MTVPDPKPDDDIDKIMNDAVEATSSIMNEPPTTRREETALSTNDDDDDDVDEDEDYSNEPEWRQRRYRHWKDSAFAVGCVNPDWKDDQVCCGGKRSKPQADDRMCVNAWVCGCLGARRVGNLIVLCQRMETVEEVYIDPETGVETRSKRQRPKLLWVVGPYWYVMLFVTYPIILAVSGWTRYKVVVDSNLWVIIVWSISTFVLVFSLAMIACRNPGVLYRRLQVPNGNDPDGEWRWNDQARTYRPPRAKFDPECQAVIEGFDHTCPWTGTAIGSRNMCWFRTFVTMVPVCIALSIFLNVFSGFSTAG